MDEVLVTLIGLGIPGFLTYLILVKMNIVIFTRDHMDEKIMFIGVLSFINVGIVYLILELSGIEVMTVSGFAVTLISTLLLSTFIYPFIIKNTIKAFEYYLTKTNQKHRSNKPIMDGIYDYRPEGCKYIHLVIFNFEHEYLASGYLELYSYTENRLVLKPDGEGRVHHVSFKEVFNSLEGEKKNILIDTENQFLIYIIYYVD